MVPNEDAHRKSEANIGGPLGGLFSFEESTMNKTALDLVSILATLETVGKSTLLTPTQRQVIISEIKTALPDVMFCASCKMTLSIITAIVERSDGSTKKPEGKAASKTKDDRQSKGPKRKPAGPPASNTRGPSEVPVNVIHQKE